MIRVTTVLMLLMAAAAEPLTPSDVLLDPEQFVCSDGRLLAVTRNDATGVAQLLWDGEVLTLMEQVGRTPRRFVSGMFSLDLEASAAAVRTGRRGSLVTRCRKVGDAPTPGVVWGRIDLADPLPADARVRVFLTEMPEAGGPAVELASTTVAPRGNPRPLHFLIEFPPDRATARPGARRLEARVEVPQGGRPARVTHVSAEPVAVAGEGLAAARLVLVPARP